MTSTDLPDVLGNLRYNVMRNTKDRCRYIPAVGFHIHVSYCRVDNLRNILKYPTKVLIVDKTISNIMYHIAFLVVCWAHEPNRLFSSRVCIAADIKD